MNPEQIISEYEAWMLSWDASPRTISARKTLLRARLKEWGLPGFTYANVIEFMGRPSQTTGRPRSRWTKSTYHAHLSNISDFLVGAGYLDVTPMEDVRKPRRPKSQPRPLSDTELDMVLAVARGETRDWIMLALHAGLRAHEIAKLRGQDVTISGIYVLGKGAVAATLPCHPDLWEMAQRYPRMGYWFPGSEDGHVRSQTISMVVGKFFRALGIEGSIHRVRHSFVTRLVRSGVNLRRVQRLARHASLETTAAYAAVDEDELRDAILMLPSTTPPVLPAA